MVMNVAALQRASPLCVLRRKRCVPGSVVLGGSSGMPGTGQPFQIAKLTSYSHSLLGQGVDSREYTSMPGGG